ncbi:MAG: SIS domain-containing protein [Gemmatimonadetes bacterium]|nr:SIS domain-containing protein [Gemmatimonadota bacterium]
MAERFSRGGRLIACGVSPADRSDVRHVAVEFVHPVIVGKRALPALGLTPDGGPLPLQVDLLVEPHDILIAFGERTAPLQDPLRTHRSDLAAAVSLARHRGALTVAFSDLGAEWQFPPPSDDAFVRQELVETIYHVLWELVHVFFDHRGLLEERTPAAVHDPGDSRFLYPFLGEAEDDLEAVLEDVRRSVVMKAEDVAELRRRMLETGAGALLAGGAALRRSLDAGGRVLAFGNGGSATDAADVVADFRAGPHGLKPRPALDLTEDPAILSAIGNDIGPDAVFARQIIAYGREGDVALAFSTSGDSRNVVRALEEAGRRGIQTMAFVGYDGGRIAAEALADTVIIAPSQHIPRIQEAHATAYHLLRELVEHDGLPGDDPGTSATPPVAPGPERR